MHRSLPPGMFLRVAGWVRVQAQIVMFGLIAGGLLVNLGRAETPIPRRSRASIYHPPKVLRYEPQADDVIRQTSVFNGEEPRPGGALGYYGNRLTQFRFRGPAGQGGIYDAFEQERLERSLDPAKYRYRWRY